MDELLLSDRTRYNVLKTELDRVAAAIAVIVRSMDEEVVEEDAYEELREAEAIRDISPEAYQAARTAYHTLTEGPEWLVEEEKRVAASDVDPEVNRYKTAYTDLANGMDAQQKMWDAMTAVQSGVLSLKDDIQYTTSLFKTQLEALKSQINIERRGREPPPETVPWVDLLLNIALVVGLIVAGAMIVWKMRKTPSPPPALGLGPPPVPRFG
jgi:hypothetical protein